MYSLGDSVPCDLDAPQVVFDRFGRGNLEENFMGNIAARVIDAAFFGVF